MLPNRTLVAVIVALTMGQVALGAASAQAVGTADVFVERVDYGIPRIAEVAADINITVRNRGTVAFNPPTGWQIFVGLNGNTDSACITPGQDGQENLPDQFQPCYIRMGPGSTNPASIPAGEARVYRVSWTARPQDANTSAYIWTEILGLTESPGTPQQCSGVDSPQDCDDNFYNLTGVRIDRLGVRAVPNRQAPEGAGLDANDPWRFSEIPPTTVCPVATGPNPDVIDRGCWATPGTTMLAAFTVNNTGTIEDTYTPTLTSSSAANYFQNVKGYQFSFAPPIVRINAGQSQVVRMSIYVPENETANRGININQSNLSVSWVSQTLNTIHTDMSNVAYGCTNDNPCDHPTVPTFIAGQRFQFNLTTHFTYDDALPGEASEFRINLTNLGNFVDRYNVSFVRDSRTINDSWSPTIDTSGPLTDTAEGLQPGGNHSVRILVTPPGRTTNDTYWFDVAVKSRGDTQNRATCKYWETLGPDPTQVRVTGTGPVCIVRFTVNVRQTWNISGTSDLTRRDVPGKTVQYNLLIRNDGNGYDNLSLDLATTQAGWNAVLSETTLRLPPGNASTVTLTVTAPPNLPENTQAAFYVNTTSSGPPDIGLDQRSKVSLPSFFTIARGPNIRLDAVANTTFVDAGTEASFTLTATNVGNVADNFTVPLPSRPADWGVTVDPPFQEVQPGGSFPITVTLRAPSTATVGEKAAATVRVASSVDRSLDATLVLEGRVSGPDLFVDNVLVDAASPYSGDQLNISVVLGNSGNKPADKNATLRVYFVQNGVERVIAEKVYDPSNDATRIAAQRRLTETFAWDTTGIEGAGVLLARIDVGDSVPEIDDSAASNERTRPLTLRTFDIKVTPAVGLTARPGELVAYANAPNVFTLRYDGNQIEGEPVLVRVESEHGWLTSAQEINLRLPRGTAIEVAPELLIPTLPGAAKDTLTLTVIPSLRPSEVLRVSTLTTLLDEEKPLVTRITATPANAKLGEPVTITAEVQDATGVAAVTAYVTTPTNETSALTLAQASPGVWTANRTFGVAGTYRVAAEAIDAADPPNRNTTRETSGTFTMTPGSAPVIKLAAGQGTTIRTGSSVKVSITDPLGVGKASYSIRGVSYDLRAPDYTIDTSTFQNGLVEVNVTAENIYGVASSAKFTFTVDNEIPTISEVAMDPARPRAGDHVTVTIRTQAEVQAVDVLVKKDGQLVDTINATRKGSGNFEIEFDAEEGDYRVDVTARDAAGNAKLAEGAVVFSARPGSPLPMPTWIALVGLALVALALSRRR